MEKLEHINFNQTERITAIGKALSSELRIRILKLLGSNEHNVNEIAELLEIPASSAAMHVKVLEESGLIHTELKSAVRGSMKVCSRSVQGLVLDFQEEVKEKVEKISMPIGNYVDYKVEPTCGIVSKEGYIDIEDEPAVFYNPRRTEAKLIWIGNGYLEYRFPNAVLKKKKLSELILSAEICSEDHEYNMECPSDITLWINNIEVGTYKSPSDFGGRRGRLNPMWWPEEYTQYGVLTTWKITKDGTYLENDKTSDIGVDQFHLEEENYISVRIGIKENAEHKRGMNIFGDGFGDYPQDIVLKLIYEKDNDQI